MAKPIINTIEILDERTDLDSRLTRQYKIVGTDLNVENVKTAYTADGTQRLPQKGEKNPYQSANKATVVSKVTVSQSGTEEGGAAATFRVTVNYAPQDEASASNRDPENPDNFRFPWDKPAKISISNSTMTVDMWGTDFRGQPLLYSNGEAVNLTKELPLSVISIQRANRLDKATSGLNLNKTFFQRVNLNQVDITVGGQTQSWNPRELLCASVDIEPELFTYNDPVDGRLISIPYATESITLIGNIYTWATRVVDQGNLVRNSSNELVKVTEDGREISGPHMLNGQGYALLEANFTAGLRGIRNAWDGLSTTGNGITVDAVATKAAFGSAANARAVFLAFLTYDEIDFTDLRINERLP